MFEALGNFLLYPLALIVTLGILITVHEFGHFWVARRLGVKVLRFSIGFGRPLWLRRSKVDQTEFAVAAIPLGGYVRMLDEREGEVASHELERAFNRQPVGSRIAIVAAGPLFNFAFAILAYCLMFMIGVPGMRPLLEAPVPDSIAAEGGFQAGDVITAVDGRPTPTLSTVALALVEHGLDGEVVEIQVRDQAGQQRYRSLDLRDVQDFTEDGRLLDRVGLTPWRPRLPPVIERVTSDGAAAQAGLQGGDRILAVDGQPVTEWQQWADYVRARPDQRLQAKIERAGQTMTLPVTPAAVASEQGEIGLIGAYAQVPEGLFEAQQVIVRYNPLHALGAGLSKTWEMSTFTLRMLGRMVIGQVSLENLSGPITIAQFAGQTASIGGIAFLSFLALVSISLGVLNLLPVPVLDGGHLLYYFIELVKGSPLSESMQQLGQRFGIVVLVMLMTVALVNDVARLLG